MTLVKILILNDYGVLSGGAEHAAVVVRDHLRQRGHDVRLLTSTARPLPLANQADITCFGSEGPLRRVLQATNPMAAIVVRRTLAAFRPDLVAVRMFMTQLSPLVLPPLARLPAVLHIENYQAICPINTKVLPDGSSCHQRAGAACHRAGCVSRAGVARTLVQHGLWRRWAGVFRAVIANSHWTRHRLEADGVRVTDAVWHGVPVRPQRPPLQEPPSIAFAGRLVEKKGVEVLLRALLRVRESIPGATLVIAGDGPDRARVERAIAQLGLHPAVRMLGHMPRESLERHFAPAWVHVVPSIWEEPFGLVAAEAMMRGTAVVVSAAGGLSEFVRDGQDGTHVPPGDADALAAALIPLLRDRELAERFGASAREFALRELTEDRSIDRTIEIYRRVTAA